MSAKFSTRPAGTAVAVISLLGLMAVLAGGAALQESVTPDEVAHLGAGISYLQRLDMRLNEEHPPLAKVVAALPLALRGAHADYSHLSWTFSGGFFKQYLGEWVFGHYFLASWNEPRTILFWGRLPMLLLTLALGIAVYFFGAKLGGPSGGLLCLCAYATMPTFLAFGPLVLTDVPVTLFCLLTIWAFADMWQCPTARATVKFGFVLAAALLTKFSAGLLFFCFLAFILSLRLRPAGGQPAAKVEVRTWRRLRWRRLMQGVAVASLLVYAVYFVLSWNEPTNSFSVIPHGPTSAIVRRLLMPAWVYLRGLIGFAMTADRVTYLLGKSYPHGVWFYFPVVFLLKSPLPFLGLLLLALVAALLAKTRKAVSITAADACFHWRMIWISLVIFVAACLVSRITISIRHFTVPLILLIVLLAPLPRALDSLRATGWPKLARTGAWLTLALGLSLLLIAVKAYPYYLPFLNSFTLGRPAYTFVSDSNLDWNQSLSEVDRFAREHGLQRVLVDEYGFSEPGVFAEHAVLWNCQEPSPADAGQPVFVSANMIADAHNCSWLLQYPHQSLAGGSMYVFQLPKEIPAAGGPNGPPLPDQWHNLAGIPWKEDARLVILNCIRDPEQMQPTIDRMTAAFQAAARERK